MRYLAIDYGTKRIGLAVCDELEFAAYPLTTVHRSRSRQHDLGEIARLARVNEAGGIVVGLPLHADGSRSPMAEGATRFANDLAAHLTLPFFFQDEFLTSSDAEAELIEMDVSRERRKKIIDQMAAVHLLEAFLRAKKENKQQ